LLIDDLQNIGDKIAAQEELLRTVDILVPQHRRIVVTLAQDPLDTPVLLPGLASRLSAGLTVPLQPPGPAAQRTLLRRFAADLNLVLSDALLDVILNELPRTAGPITPLQLRPILIRVQQRVRDGQQPLDDQLVRECLTCRPATDGPELRSITQHVSRYFNVRTNELKGPARQQRIVRARGVAMLLARRLTGSSLDEVGRHFGNRDHTTVLHACRKTESLMEDDPAIRQAVQELTAKLCGP
jgi:chromosomal replication initiator protein